MLGLAGMAFAACSSEDEVAGVDQSPKSVTISLANVMPATRNADAPIADATDVALADLQVFFTDGTNLYKGKTTEGTEADHYFANLTEFNAATRDAVFHFLPAGVNKVIVVGNKGAEWTGVTTYAGLVETLEIANEQNDQDLYLYGESGLTLDDEDTEGHPLYKAAVTLEPRVSRIEVSAFEYLALNGQRKYSEIVIDQVMLNNYYTKANSQNSDASTVKKETISAGTVFGILNDATGWLTDKFVSTPADGKLDVVTLNAASTYKKVYATTGNPVPLRPAYHFFPDASDIATTGHPQLIVKLIGTLAEGGTKVPLYLATSTFTPAVTSDVAKIYVMNFQFDDNDLEDPEKCVEVTVGVKSWDVVAVTPEF